jgi:hypothetical protein
MSLAELIPVLRALSRTEKLQAMQFLLAEITRSEAEAELEGFSETASFHATIPRLYRKGDVLVIETAPLESLDINDLINQAREERIQQLFSL